MGIKFDVNTFSLGVVFVSLNADECSELEATEIMCHD